MKIRVILSGIEPIEDLKKTGKCVVAGSLEKVFLKEGTGLTSYLENAPPRRFL